MTPPPPRKWLPLAALLAAGLALLAALRLAPAVLEPLREWLSQSQQPVGTLSNGLRMASTGLFLLIAGGGWLWQKRHAQQSEPTPTPGLAKGWGAGFLAAAAVVACTIIVANPRGMYPTNFYPPRWLLARPVKMDAYQALPVAPDLVILGSSRTFTIAPVDVQARLGYTAFNASVEGMRMAEMPAFVRFVTQEHPPGPMVLLIEAAPYAADDLVSERLPNRLLPYLSPDQAFSFIYNRYTSLLNLDHFSESVYQMLREPKESLDWSFQPDGMGILPLSSPAGLEEGVSQAIANIPAHCQPPSRAAMRYYQQVVDLAARYQMAVVFIIPPYHPRYYAAQMAPGSDFDACKAQAVAFLQAMAEEYSHIFFLDYTDPATIGSLDTAEGYYDYQHMTQENAARLLEAAAATLQQAYQIAEEWRTR